MFKNNQNKPTAKGVPLKKTLVKSENSVPENGAIFVGTITRELPSPAHKIWLIKCAYSGVSKAYAFL